MKGFDVARILLGVLHALLKSDKMQIRQERSVGYTDEDVSATRDRYQDFCTRIAALTMYLFNVIKSQYSAW